MVATETPSSAATALLDGGVGLFIWGWAPRAPSDLGVERQLQARPWPTTLEQASRAGAGYPSVTHVRTAEADVGSDGIGKRNVLVLAIRLEHGHAAIPECRDTNAAIGLHGQTVEPLEAGQGADHTPLSEGRWRRHDSGLG